MDAHLSKACWRAGAKLIAGFALIGAVVGIRIVTAKPTGIEAEIAELERFEAEQASAGSVAGGADEGTEPGEDASAPPPRSASGMLDGGLRGDPERAASGSDAADPERMVRCHFTGEVQFMRAADCATRGGALEDLPPPEPEDPTASRSAP